MGVGTYDLVDQHQLVMKKECRIFNRGGGEALRNDQLLLTIFFKPLNDGGHVSLEAAWDKKV